jgi:hypothetical protein
MGNRLTPMHTNRQGKRYRYYAQQSPKPEWANRIYACETPAATGRVGLGHGDESAGFEQSTAFGADDRA